MDRFTLQVEIDRRVRSYQVEKLPDITGFERYRIIGTNKSIIIRTNRPMLRNKGLKTKRPSWQVMEGAVSHTSSSLENIMAALFRIIDK